MRLSYALRNAAHIRGLLVSTGLSIIVFSALTLGVRSHQKKREGDVSSLLVLKQSAEVVSEKVSLTFDPLKDVLPHEYSYKYTSLGFGVKELNFLEGQQASVEKKMLALIPKGMRKRASLYIRPVLLLSQRHQVDPLWVLSVMWTESHFKYRARSSVGASGLMQLMPGTRRYLYQILKKQGKKLAIEEESFDIKKFFLPHIKKVHEKTYQQKLANIEIGVIYLKRLLKEFNYNHRYATVAYNMGPGWTRSRLRRKLPVGNRNDYLNKVTKAYSFMAKRI